MRWIDDKKKDYLSKLKQKSLLMSGNIGLAKPKLIHQLIITNPQSPLIIIDSNKINTGGYQND